MPLLHINADDFGLHRDIDRGILRCVDAGRVTGVSVAANGSALDWSAVRGLAKRVNVGVHVTLVGEPWLTLPKLFANWSTLVPWLMAPGRSAVLEREVRAQVLAMREAGITPTHLDSHQHVHVMPTIWPVVLRVAEAFHIPRVRVPAVPDRRIAKRSLAGRALQWLSERRRTPESWPCIGIAHAGQNTVEILTRELASAKGADVELVAHPAIDTPELQSRYPAWRFDWKTETDALLSEEWGRAVEAAGYQFAPPTPSS